MLAFSPLPPGEGRTPRQREMVLCSGEAVIRPEQLRAGNGESGSILRASVLSRDYGASPGSSETADLLVQFDFVDNTVGSRQSSSRRGGYGATSRSMSRVRSLLIQQRG